MSRRTSKKLNRDYRTYPGRLFLPARGVCRWCGLNILNIGGAIDYKRTFCGPICKSHYDLRADPKKMRQHIFFRDNGICAECGTHHRYNNAKLWEADHILPLMIAFGNPEFWEPENLRILCRKPCHQIKTREDRKKYRKRDRRWIEEENAGAYAFRDIIRNTMRR